MKKVAKLLAVLLPLAIVVTGCQNSANGDVSGGGDDDNNVVGDGWVTVFHQFYLYGRAPEFNFHVNNGYVEIQRMYLNNSASATGAAILFDFTQTPTQEHSEINPWWQNTIGNAAQPGASIQGTGADRLFRLEAAVEGSHSHGGGFGSPLLEQFTHIGFVFRTTDVGDTRFAFGVHPNHIEVNFSTLLD